ncbi:MAG: hypothetical protein RBS40_00280 [Rhodocyclaceae bacterium]|jgi:hypothetical protein|nr:hypothetical protein [Rhodocyclaceae bacterium]
MLLENPLDMGQDGATEATAQPFQKVLRHASEQEYYAQRKAAREAEEERQLAEVEPVIAAVETRLAQGYPFGRLILMSEVDQEVLSQMLSRILPSNFTGRYTMQTRAEAAQKLSAWLEGDARDRRAKPGHAPTPFHNSLYNFGVETLQHSLLSVFVSGVGNGKSKAGETIVADYPRRHNHCGAVMIKIQEADRTVAKCLTTILAGLRGSPRHAVGDAAYDLICKELRPGDLVIIDEANRFGKVENGAMVDVIRDLWEASGAGFLLLGNPILKGRHGVLENDLYDAFASRTRIQEIPYLSPADVEAWMLWMGLTGKQLTKKFTELAARWVDASGKEHLPRPGGLRKLTNIVEDVKRRNPGADLTGELVLSYITSRGVA